MGTIHLQHIKAHLEDVFDSKIDLSDVVNIHKEPSEIENFFLTRSLAAYAIMRHSEISPEEAANSITDGSNDNGIDGIYFDGVSKVLYLVQSKWIHNGSGEPDNGSVKKFISGIKDLLNFHFDRFNEKIKSKETIIRNAIRDHKTRYQIILTYTGINDLADPSRRDFDDLLRQLNDASELVSFSVFNQSRIHTSLSTDSSDPIELTINLKSWGKITDPINGYYGQVNGREIYGWWNGYRNRLFQKNLRGVLGETDVNSQIIKSLKDHPEKFWFLNNGVTLICDTAEKNMVGAGSTDYGQFDCKNISIVNGAQTVSTIGRFGEDDPEKLDKVFVSVRVITLSESSAEFGQEITKATNTQNRIEKVDFVGFDPEQRRIRDELLIDGIDYRISRGEFEDEDRISFDLTESTVAMSCASGDISIAVQLKREIGKLWDDLDKAPYKKMFNANVTGRFVYNCVMTQRLIDIGLKSKENSLEDGTDQSIIIHGNRMISLMIFDSIQTNNYITGKFDFTRETLSQVMLGKVNKYFEIVKSIIEDDYKGDVLVTLFKNTSKCSSIYDKANSSE